MSNPYYETGSCSSLADFVTKFITFCTSASIDVANRFTEETVTTPQTLNTSGAPSGGTTYPFVVKCLSRDGYYWWIRYHTTGGMFGMPAPNGGAASWNSVTGKPGVDAEIFPRPGAGTYHFESVDKVVFATCVLSSGVHVHFSMGKITPVGSWTGGEYFTPTYHDTANAALVNGDPLNTRHIFMFQLGNTSQRGLASQRNGIMRCVYNSKNFALMDYSDVTPPTGYNLVCGTGILRASGDSGDPYVHHDAFGPNSFTPHRSSGADITYQLLRDADDGLFYDLGSIPGVRFVNTQLIDPGAVQPNDWIVFPLSIKGLIGSISNYASSANYGVAFYKGP